jgi:poly(beta-D-mannuronate) lyase
VRKTLTFLALSAACLVALSSPAAAAVPGDVLDLTNWKLTLPIDSDSNGAPDEIKQPELRTYENLSYFKDVAGPGVQFRAPTSGTTTSGSHYPRCELREMKNGGRDKAGWVNHDGKKHVMTVTQAILRVPDIKPHIVVGQIHDAKRDIILLRAERTATGTYRIVAKANDVTLSPDLDSDYQLGTTFKAKLKADGHGGVVAKYWKSPTSSVLTQATAFDDNTLEGGGWYFKAGSYPQASSTVAPSDSHYGTGVGKVIIYALTVSHG